MTITDFLLQRIAEDELAARRAASHVAWPRMCDWVAERSDPDVGLYVLDHNPARVLAECEAKRRIVEAAQYAADVEGGGAEIVMFGGYPAVHPGFAGTVGVLNALAAIYADHPDYDEAWRP